MASWAFFAKGVPKGRCWMLWNFLVATRRCFPHCWIPNLDCWGTQMIQMSNFDCGCPIIFSLFATFACWETGCVPSVPFARWCWYSYSQKNPHKAKKDEKGKQVKQGWIWDEAIFWTPKKSLCGVGLPILRGRFDLFQCWVVWTARLSETFGFETSIKQKKQLSKISCLGCCWMFWWALVKHPKTNVTLNWFLFAMAFGCFWIHVAAESDLMLKKCTVYSMNSAIEGQRIITSKKHHSI